MFRIIEGKKGKLLRDYEKTKNDELISYLSLLDLGKSKRIYPNIRFVC